MDMRGITPKDLKEMDLQIRRILAYYEKLSEKRAV